MGLIFERWLMLTIYCLNSFTNAMLWVTFSSITSQARIYYNINSTAVNMLSIVFMLTFLPSSILASYLNTKYNFRILQITGSLLDLIGAIIRYLSIFIHSFSPHLSFGLLLFGQTISSIAQPMFSNSPATLAGLWFPIEGRDIATTIGTMFYPLGNAAALILAPILVTSNTQKTHVNGMALLLFIELILCGMMAIITIIFFKARPLALPSESASKRAKLRKEASDSRIKRNSLPQQNTPLLNHPLEVNVSNTNDTSLSDNAFSVVLDEVKTLLSDFEFIKLMIGFSLGIGTFNALLTVIEQLGEPAGYSSADAGLFGGVFLGSGLLGAAIVAPLLEITHAYRPALKMGAIIGSGAVLFFVSSIRPNNKTILTVSWGTLGFTLTPLLPICFSNAAEVSYPIAEETALSLLGTIGQYTGILSVFAFDYFISLRRHYTNWYTAPASIFMVSSLAFAFVFAFFYNGEYKRLAIENSKN